MDIEFDFKGDPIGGAITNCKSFTNYVQNRLSSKNDSTPYDLSDKHKRT